MTDRALVCLHGLGGSPGEWMPAARALGWERVHAALPPSGAAILVGNSFGAAGGRGRPGKTPAGWPRSPGSGCGRAPSMPSAHG